MKCDCRLPGCPLLCYRQRHPVGADHGGRPVFRSVTRAVRQLDALFGSFTGQGQDRQETPE